MYHKKKFSPSSFLFLLDSGWKKIEIREVRDKHPGSATLHMCYIPQHLPVVLTVLCNRVDSTLVEHTEQLWDEKIRQIDQISPVVTSLRPREQRLQAVLDDGGILVVEKSGKNDENPWGMEGETSEAGKDLLDEVGLLLLQGLQDEEIVVPDRRLVLLSEQSLCRIRIPEK